MACWDTSPYTCTYDSDTGEGKDYDALTDWEVATDNDLSGYGTTYLDCFDSQVHNDGGCQINGATNTNSSRYRGIRSSSSCATAWAGKEGTGANFAYTGGSGYLIYVSAESHFRLEHLALKQTANDSTTRNCLDLRDDHTRIIGCVVHDCVNSGSGVHRGINIVGSTGTLIYATVVRDCEGYGIGHNTSLTAASGVICCTSINNSDDGISQGASGLLLLVWSTYCGGNSVDDFQDASWFNTDSGWNSSEDDTSDLVGDAGDDYKNSNDLLTGGEIDSDGLATEAISWANGVGDNAGRNPLNDITASYTFDGFFPNDPLVRHGVEGTSRTRLDYDVADSAWDVGASCSEESSEEGQGNPAGGEASGSGGAIFVVIS